MDAGAVSEVAQGNYDKILCEIMWGRFDAAKAFIAGLSEQERQEVFKSDWHKDLLQALVDKGAFDSRESGPPPPTAAHLEWLMELPGHELARTPADMREAPYELDIIVQAYGAPDRVGAAIGWVLAVLGDAAGEHLRPCVLGKPEADDGYQKFLRALLNQADQPWAQRVICLIGVRTEHLGKFYAKAMRKDGDPVENALAWMRKGVAGDVQRYRGAATWLAHAFPLSD